ncbi:tetratricopeptide repeat protein [Rhodanobacter umsongensis]
MNGRIRWASMALALGLAVGGCASNGMRTGQVLAIRSQADAAYANGDRAIALQAYQGYVQAAPADPVAWTRIGNLQLLADHPDEATAAYQQALKLSPGATEAWHNMAIIRLRQAQAMLTAEGASLPANDLRKTQILCDQARLAVVQGHAGKSAWDCAK